MSQTVTDMRPSFNGGELSRRMEGRTDTAIYRVGAAELANFVPTVEGPIVKRPGFRFIRPAAMTAAWVSRFVVSRTQSYLIEWSEGALRFFTNGGRIETDGAPYQVAVPYTAAQAPAVRVQQSRDRQYMAHRAHPLAALSRTGAETFVHEAVELLNGPFAPGNSDRGITVQADGTTGGVILTASGPIFAAGDVGGLFRLEALDFSSVAAWAPGLGPVAAGSLIRSDGKVYSAVGSSRTGSVAPTHEDGAEWDGANAKDINDKGPYGVQWQYLHDRFGMGRIVEYLSPTQIRMEVTRRLPDQVTLSPSWRWSFGAFSPRRGYPNVVTIWNQRLIVIRDFDIWGSVVGDYRNFQSHTSSGLVAADLSFSYRLSASDPVLWAVADAQLLVGTASGEYPIGALNTAAAPGPGNIGVKRPSFYGCDDVAPLQLGTALHFVQRGGAKLREGEYDYQRDALVARNTCAWARHIGKGGIRQISYAQEPEELIYAVRADGQVAARAYSPEQEVKGWSRIVHGGGRIVSADTLPSEDGTTDELWALVDRDGARSVEQLAAWWDEDGGDQASAFFVDSGLSSAVAPARTRFSGLQHLAGMAVSVLADGAVVAGLTVSAAGTIDLPDAAGSVTIGLPYTARYASLRVEAETRGGTAQGKRKRLVSAILRVIDASAGLFAGSLGGKLDQIVRRSTAALMDAPPPLFNGDTDGVAIGGGWDRAGQYVVEHRDPTPCIVTAIMPRFEVSDT